MKKIKRIVSVSAVVILIAALSVALISRSQRVGVHNINNDDIETMIMGDELPGIQYADNNKFIIFGNVGLLAYDTEKSKITNRIPLEDIGFEMPLCHISEDGETAYFLPGLSDSCEYLYEYDLKSGKLKKTETQSKNTFNKVKSIGDITDSEARERIEKELVNFDSMTVEINSGEYLVIGTDSDGKMKSLRAVVFDGSGNKIRSYNIFS